MHHPGRRLRVIFNPAAGQWRRRRLARVLARLEALGARVTLFETRAPGDAEAAARALGLATCDAVVAAGGDGTINEVLNGLAGSSLPLGIVPLGTANVLAAELDLPRDSRGVALAIACGRPHPVFAGVANGRRFAMMVGVGFDARVVEGIDLGLKRWVGKAAYVASACAQLVRYQAPRYAVEIDGTIHSAAAVLIAKGHYYGGRFVIAAEARLDDPVLQVVLFAGAARADLLRYAAALATNSVKRLMGVRCLAAREVRVSGPAGERVQLDGDLGPALPLVATVAPDRVLMLR